MECSIVALLHFPAVTDGGGPCMCWLTTWNSCLVKYLLMCFAYFSFRLSAFFPPVICRNYLYIVNIRPLLGVCVAGSLLFCGLPFLSSASFDKPVFLIWVQHHLSFSFLYGQYLLTSVFAYLKVFFVVVFQTGPHCLPLTLRSAIQLTLISSMAGCMGCGSFSIKEQLTQALHVEKTLFSLWIWGGIFTIIRWLCVGLILAYSLWFALITQV